MPPHQAPLGSWPYGWAVSMTGPTLAQQLFPAAGDQAPGGGNAAFPR
ncbi:hypothetical protein H9X86_07330 [Pseudoflavonifractor capillosus]|nr:hypothetical protein [Pseudoflavonifractor capillosus]MBM6897181.1 hypothetical protein [Pseudoflavonifractor capillosus]